MENFSAFFLSVDKALDNSALGHIQKVLFVIIQLGRYQGQFLPKGVGQGSVGIWQPRLVTQHCFWNSPCVCAAWGGSSRAAGWDMYNSDKFFISEPTGVLGGGTDTGDHPRFECCLGLLSGKQCDIVGSGRKCGYKWICASTYLSSLLWSYHL